MVGGHTVTSSVEVAHPTIAVERVPGLVPAVPVRPVPPVLIAVAGVQVGRKAAPAHVPDGVLRHAGDFSAVVVEQGEPKTRQSGGNLENPDGEVLASALRTGHR